MSASSEISFVDDNMMLVDGKKLQTALLSANRNNMKLAPGELQAILTLGDQAIRTQIEVVYDKVQRQNPGLTVHRPSIWTMQLSGPRHEEWRTLSERGRTNGGVITNSLELQPDFREYWHAVERAGFVPEVRRASMASAGIWLMSRIDLLP